MYCSHKRSTAPGFDLFLNGQDVSVISVVGYCTPSLCCVGYSAPGFDSI